jgi:hypothetical protein
VAAVDEVVGVRLRVRDVVADEHRVDFLHHPEVVQFHGEALGDGADAGEW